MMDMRGSRIGKGRLGPGSPGKSQNLVFMEEYLSVPPGKNHKAIKPAFNIGPLSARKRTVTPLFLGILLREPSLHCKIVDD